MNDTRQTIVKIIDNGDGAANWAIRKGDTGTDYIKSGLAYKDAVKEIDKLSK